MKRILAIMAACICVGAFAEAADVQGWQHSGSIYLLTTPEGADLPTSAAVENFPVLVRLNKTFFDFTEAKADGSDIRFSSSDGTALPYQIESWDAAEGEACVWVRVPAIKGNDRQEIKLCWGKSDAVSESSGPSVFNDSNGYLSVWHMTDPVSDDVGTLESKDAGTKAAQGVVGVARHFPGEHGIFCGDKITNYPTGSASHSTEAWFRAEKPNSEIIGWGNQQQQGKVVMLYQSPPHMNVDCWFSGGNVTGESRLTPGEWTHVVHTFEQGEARIYVNGKLDGSSVHRGSSMAIKSPARLWIGGWWNNYDFVGDIDEVRVSKVVRSADWVKLEYENQKPMQTLVGPVVKAGSAFSVSTTKLTVLEGKSATVTAEAGGAQKVYWILKRDGRESVAAVDCFAFTFDAGRVVGDDAATVQFKAVFANETKAKDIAIAIKDAIPEPVATLKAPPKWNGRDTIEIVPQIWNLAAMKAAGAGDLKFAWNVSGGAVIKEIAADKLILKRSQFSGPITVKLVANNGGADSVVTAAIFVKEPKADPWVIRAPSNDEKPEDGQFYARDEDGRGTLHYNGRLDGAKSEVFLKLYADDKLVSTDNQKTDAHGQYWLSVRLKPGLIKYRVEFGTRNAGKQTVLRTVNDIVCGDAYIIDGQSNALATDTHEDSPAETNTWIRSYGRPSENQKADAGNLWCCPVWKARKGEKAELGWWGMELAKRLVASQKIPICIINAAAGGTRIDLHQWNPANSRDTSGDNPWANPYKLYGTMLTRVEGAKLTHGIRGILWHQGENDQSSDGPSGGYGWENYQQYFVEMAGGWKRDFPNVQHYYVFQIWPDSCSMGGSQGSGDRLREKQRTLPYLFSNMSIMSTLGVRPPGGCHFPLTGWAEFARLIQPVIERDFYGKVPANAVTAPNLRRAAFTAKDTIALEFDQPVVWDEKLAGQFYLDGEKDKVASGSVAGNVLTLKLKEPSTAKTITYLKEVSWNQDTLLMGANGIAALTFCEVAILPESRGTSAQ